MVNTRTTKHTVTHWPMLAKPTPTKGTHAKTDQLMLGHKIKRKITKAENLT